MAGEQRSIQRKLHQTQVTNCVYGVLSHSRRCKREVSADANLALYFTLGSAPRPLLCQDGRYKKNNK